jgi:integrase/recombinase XerC
MTAEEARAAWLEWLATERGAAPIAIELWGRDVTELMVFVMMSQGRMPDENALAELSPETVDAFLASRDEGGADERKRRAAAVRGFQRFLLRRLAEPPAETP